MNRLDNLLGGIKIYRKIRKGKWIFIRLRPIPYITAWFRNREPHDSEIVEQVENW